MSEANTLMLEVLSGPLDGARLELEGPLEWSREGTGDLSFPWDDQLATPQARFVPDGKRWKLEVFDTPHGTYVMSGDGRLTSAHTLSPGDLLRAGHTWILVVASGR